MYNMHNLKKLWAYINLIHCLTANLIIFIAKHESTSVNPTRTCFFTWYWWVRNCGQKDVVVGHLVNSGSINHNVQQDTSKCIVTPVVKHVKVKNENNSKCCPQTYFLIPPLYLHFWWRKKKSIQPLRVFFLALLILTLKISLTKHENS